MAGLGDFTSRTHKVALAEEFAWLDTELTADHLFIEAVVTVDDYVVDSGLRAFYNAHFEVDGVAAHVLFHRHYVKEEITVVHVGAGYGVVIIGGALFQECLIVDVTFLYAEERRKIFGGIDGVAHPGHIVDEVSLAFIEVDIYVDCLFVIGDHGVGENDGVAVAFFVVFLNDAVEVVLIVCLHEFFLTEKVDELAFLVGLLHHSLKLAVREHVVAVDIDLVDFDFVVLVDVNVDDHFIGVREVIGEVYLHYRVAETLVGVVFLDDAFGAVDDVLRDLVAFHQLESFFEVLLLTFFHPVVVDFGDSRLLTQVECQISLVPDHFVDRDLHFREKALTPEAFGRIGDFSTWNGDEISDFEPGVANDDIVFIIVGTLDLDVCDLVGFRQAGEKDVGVIDRIRRRLGAYVGSQC